MVLSTRVGAPEIFMDIYFLFSEIQFVSLTRISQISQRRIASPALVGFAADANERRLRRQRGMIALLATKGRFISPRGVCFSTITFSSSEECSLLLNSAGWHTRVYDACFVRFVRSV